MRNAGFVGHGGDRDRWRRGEEPMMMSAFDSVTKRRGVGGGGGRIAAVFEHDT